MEDGRKWRGNQKKKKNLGTKEKKRNEKKRQEKKREEKKREEMRWEEKIKDLNKKIIAHYHLFVFLFPSVFACYSYFPYLSNLFVLSFI